MIKNNNSTLLPLSKQVPSLAANPITQMSLADWKKEGERRFGSDPLAWRFVCPVCKHSQTPLDFKPYKDIGATPSSAYCECIGRYMENSQDAFKARKGDGPCNYAGYGLVKLCPIEVIHENGDISTVFAFDEPDEADRPGILWGEKHQERLHAKTVDDAIKDILQSYRSEAYPGSVPETVTVIEYQQVKVDPSAFAEVVLASALEWLDENYGDPDDSFSPSKDMIKAADVFSNEILKDYHVWIHEPTGKIVTVNAKDWINEHFPDWLVDGKLK